MPWHPGDEGALHGLAEKGASDAELNRALDAGSDLLVRLKHYSGAMFFYGGEWYWGVDRLFHLESRLRELGACKEPEAPLMSTASPGCTRPRAMSTWVAVS